MGELGSKEEENLNPLSVPLNWEGSKGLNPGAHAPQLGVSKSPVGPFARDSLSGHPHFLVRTHPVEILLDKTCLGCSPLPVSTRSVGLSSRVKDWVAMGRGWGYWQPRT
jgi:hypothetical protein